MTILLILILGVCLRSITGTVNRTHQESGTSILNPTLPLTGDFQKNLGVSDTPPWCT